MGDHQCSFLQPTSCWEYLPWVYTEKARADNLALVHAGLEEGCWAAVNHGGYPRIWDACFNEVDKLSREAEGSEDLEKKGVVDSVEGISHVKLDQHPLLFPLFARVDSFLHLNDVVQDVFAFDEPPLGAGY